MQVLFKVGWQYYKPGDIIDPPAMLGEWLINNGYATEYLEKPFSDPYRDKPALVKRAYKRKLKA